MSVIQIVSYDTSFLVHWLIPEQPCSSELGAEIFTCRLKVLYRCREPEPIILHVVTVPNFALLDLKCRREGHNG